MTYYRNMQVGKKDWRVHFNNAHILTVAFFFIKMSNYQGAWH